MIARNELEEENKAADQAFRDMLDRQRFELEERVKLSSQRATLRAGILEKLGITEEELRILLDV
jgi:hypothetical protein